MAIPFVLVEIAPSDVPAQYAAALVKACTETMDEGECVLANTQEPPEHARAIAIVTWQWPDQLFARIQVGVRRSDAPSWVTNELRFREGDALVERWKSVGYTIRTLVGGGESGADETGVAIRPAVASPEPPIPQPAHSAPGQLRSVLPPQHHAPRWALVGVFFGPGLNVGPWRTGGWGQLAQAVGTLPLYGVLSASYAIRPAEQEALGVRWLTLGGGLGALSSVGSHKLELHAQTEIIVDHTMASAQDAIGARTDHGGTWIPGIRLGVGATWPSRGPVGLTAGAEGWTLREQSSIWVGGEPAGATQSWGFRLLVGGRVSLP